ncbi:MAG: hypothetical protein K6E29_05000 [Cyanobacteria bacterium RUI128]|nr:hypothetical protein [Cyanobacteria bacterium RUI128]
MGKVGAIAVGLVFAGVATGLTGCKSERQPKFPQSEQLLSKFVASQDRVENIASGWRDGGIGMADAQSSIDSAAYRAVFNTTEAVKDSKKVAEFNRIASQNKLPEYIKTDVAAGVFLDRRIRANNLPLDQFKSVNNYIGSVGIGNDYAKSPKRQFVVDSLAYDNFFGKHQLKTDRVQRMINVVSRKIKP